MDRQAKIDKLKAQVDSIRIGGKGSARRKKKVIHKNNATDERKVTTTLKKLAVSSIPGIEEVNMFKDSGEVIHFNNPKVQASLQSNTFAISSGAPKADGEAGDESAVGAGPAAADEDDVPELVGNFDGSSAKAE
uniref:Transcription factor BTF3 n=1 Tax=Macrostomum lignano TaxID=282301 RepID=A0A1I8GL33_9PLAT